MRIVAPAGSPPWLASFAEQVNRALASAPTARPGAPAAVYAVDDAGALAALPPKDNLERLVYVRDIARLAISNGVDWVRMDTGATL